MALTMEQLKKELKETKKELKETKEEIHRISQDCVEGCWLAEQKEENDKLREEMKELKEEMAMWKASYDDDIREARAEGIDELKEENESLKKSNAQKTKVIHTLRCELQKIYKVIHEDPPVLRDYKKVLPDVEELKEEFDRYRFDHFFAEECCFCKIPLTYDDYQLSLDAGKWCCEEHYEEALEERSTDADKLREKFRKELDQKNEYIADILKREKEHEKKYEKRIFVLENALKGK